MIVKSFELKNKNIENSNFFLLYGKNRGFIEETIKNAIKPNKEGDIFTYDENEVLSNIDNFEENISNKSFFENKKIIIINRVTDKIFQIIENIIEKKIQDIAIILKSDVLEKKSKLRNFFEKNKNTIIIPFYEDSHQSLNQLAVSFFKEKKINISQENINLLITRCRGDRINLYNELEKIDAYTKNKKNLNTDEIYKLTNLSENFDISELIDNTLAKNKKRTLHILNENNFSADDSILILRIFMIKLKRLLKIQKEMLKKKNMELTISTFRPPIFWKDKEMIKKQIKILSLKKLENLLIDINNLELTVKKNPLNSVNIILDFILEQATRANN